MKRLRLGRSWLAALCLVTFPLTAVAQIEEVIVTAQKREQSLQDVPIALQAFSGDQIRNQNILRASDITTLAPNIAISQQNAANQSIAIRGVGTADFFGGTPGSVGIYMDEVTMGSPFLTASSLFDMERVEVLRGPQNTLFGRNTTGGAVNYISNKPEVGGESDGYINFTYGAYNRIEVEAGKTFQLGDTVAMRVAGTTYNRDGIWNNLDTGADDYGDKDRKAVRGWLVWEPSDRTTVSVGGNWGEEDSEIDFAKVTSFNETVANGNFADGAFLFLAPPTRPEGQIDWSGNPETDLVNNQGLTTNTDDWHGIYPTGDTRHDQESWGLILKLEHDFGWARAVSITSYNESETFHVVSSSGQGNNRPSPVSGSPEVNIVIDSDQDFEQFSQEIRFQSADDQRLRWIGGFYYIHEEMVLSQNIAFGPANILNSPVPTSPLCNGLGIFAAAPGGCGPPIVQGGSFGLWATQGFDTGFPGAGFSDIMPFSIATMEVDAWSPYLQVDFDILPNVTVNLGIRYTEETKEMISREQGIIERSAFPTTVFFDLDMVRSTSAAQIASGLASSTCTSNSRLCGQSTTRPDLEAQEWGGKGGLTWQVNDDHMLYASYSRGFRSGKFDIEFLHGIHTGFPIEDAIPETLDNYEVGYKSTWFDNTVQLNLAGFLYKWFDKQSFFVDPLTGPGFSNVPESEGKGFEAEIKWAPNDQLFFTAALGILDTEITEGSGNISDEVGHELQNAPEETFNLSGQWSGPMGPGTLTLQANFHYAAMAKTGLAFSPVAEEIGGIERLGVRGTYEFGPEGRYSISAFGDDLLESKYCKYQFSLQAINGTVTCNASEGAAMWGLTAGMRFN